MLLGVTLLAVLAPPARARAVDISSTWLLPEEGFPVFYRYFRDRITWYEADAVCQFHHANLVTVDSTAQYDAMRAYLKELDITSSVWLGLARARSGAGVGAGAHFTWADYRRLSGEGWWRAPPPPPPPGGAASAPLCTAADPASDYRWTARGCGGPDVASFVCELPVPGWARGAAGCLLRALPALSAVYLPERAAVQLTTDCGLAGVKKYICTADKNHETIFEELSCGEVDERESSSAATADGLLPAPVPAAPASATASAAAFATASATSSTAASSAPSQAERGLTMSATVGVGGIPKSKIIDESSWRSKLTTNQPLTISRHLPAKDAIDSRTLNNSVTPEPEKILIGFSTTINETGGQNQTLPKVLGELNTVASYEGKLENNISKNNDHSNEILKVLFVDDLQTNRLSENAEQEVNEQSKMFHDEVARHGNLETIFTQPTDHFIPPLIIAKAKMSNDMKVLSLNEKKVQKSTENRSTAFPLGWPPSKEAQIYVPIQYNQNINRGVSVNSYHSANSGTSIAPTSPLSLIDSSNKSAKVNINMANKSLTSSFPKKYQAMKYNKTIYNNLADSLDPRIYNNDADFSKEKTTNLRQIKTEPPRPKNTNFTLTLAATQTLKQTTAAVANTSTRAFIAADISTLTYAVDDITPTFSAADSSTRVATFTYTSSQLASVNNLTPTTETSDFSTNTDGNSQKNTTATHNTTWTAAAVDSNGYLYVGLNRSLEFSENFEIPDSLAESNTYVTSRIQTNINVTPTDKSKEVLLDSRIIINDFKYNASLSPLMASSSAHALVVGSSDDNMTPIGDRERPPAAESGAAAAGIDRESMKSAESTTGTVAVLAVETSSVDEQSELKTASADKQGEPVELDVEIVRGDADLDAGAQSKRYGDAPPPPPPPPVHSTLLSGAEEEEETRPARSRRLQLDRPRRKFNPFRILG